MNTDTGLASVMRTQGPNRILVVDDEQVILDEFVHSLTNADEHVGLSGELDGLERELFDEADVPVTACQFEVVTCTQGKDAVEAVRQSIEDDKPFAVAFLDIRMPPGISGAEAARRMRKIDPELNIVIVTGTTMAGHERNVEDLHALDRLFFFQKPFHDTECRQLAAVLTENWHADRALKQSNEILEHRVAERTRELHQLAYCDTVTALPNRNGLTRKLQELLAHAPYLVTVILLDVERFSLINETLGYDAGDRLLKLIADRLMGSLTRTDIVGRFGADGFACLMDGSKNEEQCHQEVRRIQDLFASPFELDGKRRFVRVSCGVAIHPTHGDDAQELLRCAESALNRSKQHLLHRAVYYSQEMGERSRRRISLEAQLTKAISRDEVTPYFQPQLSLDDGATIGAEALARWIQPGGHVVSPGEFIGLAEEIGLSGALFQSMLRQSVAALAECNRRLGHYVPFSINVSAYELKSRDLPELVKAALRAEDLPPEALKLELTESVLMDDLDNALGQLHELKDFGVDVQIDDFGTGYSSLSYLAQLPVQSLKIDQSFVFGITEQAPSQRVVQAMIAMGHGLGIRVIAEGVETQEQLTFLQGCGCDTIQGFLIARPMPLSELKEWLANEEGQAIPIQRQKSLAIK